MVVVTEQISISVQSLKDVELTEGVVVTEQISISVQLAEKTIRVFSHLPSLSNSLQI